MGENVSEDYTNPQGFEENVSLYAARLRVSQQKSICPERTRINISHVIQAFFDSRFPDFAMNEKTTMGISGPGKIG